MSANNSHQFALVHSENTRFNLDYNKDMYFKEVYTVRKKFQVPGIFWLTFNQN